MTNSKTILKEIETLKTQISDKKQNEFEKFYNEITTSLTLFKDMEKYKKLKNSDKYKKLEQEEIEEIENNKLIKIKLNLLKCNLYNAIFIENMPIICEIWNKYEGKPYGQRTQEKIRDEIYEKTNLRVYICNEWSRAKITIYINANNCNWVDNIEAGGKTDDIKALDGFNKILKLNSEDFKIWYIGEFVENVEEQAKKIVEEHKKLLELQKQYENEIEKYNKLVRCNINRQDKYHGIKNII